MMDLCIYTWEPRFVERIEATYGELDMFSGNVTNDLCSLKWALKTLPNDKIWDQSNLKAFADDILNGVQSMICVTYWLENIVGKGENADYQHFLPFFQIVFKRLLLQGR